MNFSKLFAQNREQIIEECLFVKVVKRKIPEWIVIKFVKNAELDYYLTNNNDDAKWLQSMQDTNQAIGELYYKLTLGDLIRISKIVMSPSIQRIESIENDVIALRSEI